MEAKPVIIIGHSLIGHLLAYRLKMVRPDLPVKLIETSGGISSWSFRDCEVDEEAINWLKPLISLRSQEHVVAIEEQERILTSPMSTILAPQFETRIARILGADLVRKSEPAIELLQDEASLIIDTRVSAYQKVKCSRKVFGAVVELKQQHGFQAPVLMDSRVRQKELIRYMKYIPLDEFTLLVQDIRFSEDMLMDAPVLEEELLWEVRKRWQIKDVLHFESSFVAIPAGVKTPWSQGKVLDLSGVVNLISGDELPDAIKLIDQMIRTSFRMGELKEVIQRYHQEKSERRFSRILRKMLFHSTHPSQRLQILQYFFKLPEPTLEKFIRGKISFLDVAMAVIGNPPLPLMKAMPLSFKNV